MADRINEQSERANVELFADLHRHELRVVAQRDKPDAIAQLNAGQVVDVEVTELPLADDGRERSLEGIACVGIEKACSELLGNSGEADLRVPTRPADRAQAQRWLAAFRAWLPEKRVTILEPDSMCEMCFCQTTTPRRAPAAAAFTARPCQSSPPIVRGISSSTWTGRTPAPDGSSESFARYLPRSSSPQC